MSAPALDQKQMLYFADPMCSWCWGFSPVITALAESHGDRLPIRPVMGGLKPGAEKPMNQSDKDEIKTHWEHVQEGTSQPFNFGFFERDGFIYDTEPACRARICPMAGTPSPARAAAHLSHVGFGTTRRSLPALARNCLA